jgi:oxygen-independent coproporphyrinogen III oxidase
VAIGLNLQQMQRDLIKKYNIAGPRYTSYPTVPYWDNNSWSACQWMLSVKEAFQKTNQSEGISLYIHLPFCESLCTYCGCNTRITVNHAVEKPYIEAVLKEWKMYLNLFPEKPIIRELHLGGGTPTFFKAENLKILIEGILENSEKHPQAEFSFEGHPVNTTREHLQTLYELDFRRVSFGVQDFEPKVQDIINRYQSYEQVETATNTAREVGFESINFDLVYGLPLQSLDTIKDTIQKTIQLKPDRIAFYSYAHVPWLKPGQRKFTEADLPADKEKRALYEHGRNEFAKAGYEDIGMDHFALPDDELFKASAAGRLHRNFMGYTPGKTTLMVGLGVSSISDSWTAFAQNVKVVEEYYKLINENKLPVFRGHILNEEDLIIRQHILNLICRYETSWKEFNEQCEALYESLPRLYEPEQDGLVDLLPFEMKVTEKGKAFVRNICMALDARLWRNLPQTRIFSSTV